jgi:hypothetical protein
MKRRDRYHEEQNQEIKTQRNKEKIYYIIYHNIASDNQVFQKKIFNVLKIREKRSF